MEPEFPTRAEIQEAWGRLGIDPVETPCCDKCGAPIETGAMALICPYVERCEFWCDEAAELRAAFNASVAHD